jgi:1,4-dihydroxy-2-naphthoate octaprenyltransferase
MIKEKPSFLKTWIIAIRPFALPASTMPVIFGTVMAVAIGNAAFNLMYFILAFFAMVLLHSGSNMLSDVNDFRKALDREPTPVSGAIVRGYISDREGLIGSIILISAGFVLGAILVYYRGLPILILGIVGIAIGVLYTVGPFALKYHALGDLAVFLAFGTLGTLGAWTVQTGTLSWIPAVWSVPISLLIVAILHANNWRDIQSDSQRSITTFASFLGDKGSMVYYGFLTFGAFGYIILLIILTRLICSFKPEMPYTFLITLAIFPLAVKLVYRGIKRKTPEYKHGFITLDAQTSKLSLLFGLLSTVALALHLIIKILV